MGKEDRRDDANVNSPRHDFRETVNPKANTGVSPKKNGESLRDLARKADVTVRPRCQEGGNEAFEK